MAYLKPKPSKIKKPIDLISHIVSKKIIRGLESQFEEVMTFEKAMDDLSREPYYHEVPPEYEFVHREGGLNAANHYRMEHLLLMLSLRYGSDLYSAFIELFESVKSRYPYNFKKFIKHCSSNKFTDHYFEQRKNLTALSRIQAKMDDSESKTRVYLIYYLLYFENSTFFEILGFLLNINKSGKFNPAFFKKFKYPDGSLKKNKLCTEYKALSNGVSVGKYLNFSLDSTLRNMIAHNNYKITEKSVVKLTGKKIIRQNTIEKKVLTLQSFVNVLGICMSRYEYKDKVKLQERGIIGLGFAADNAGVPLLFIYQLWPFAQLFDSKKPWIKTIRFELNKKMISSFLGKTYRAEERMSRQWKSWYLLARNKPEIQYKLIPVIPTTGKFIPLEELNLTYETFGYEFTGLLKIVGQKISV